MDSAALNAFETARLTPKPYHPATFLERGVALPLTTPLLAGARTRPSETHRLELIILNPSGGRGVYILPWSAIGAFCRPTMHDAMFSQRIAALPHVTPAVIRRVARQIAIEGLAGEDAAEAAQAAAESDRGDLVLANYELLMVLYEQHAQEAKAPGLSGGGPDAERLRLAVEAAGARLGRSGDWAANALEELAEVVAGLGVRKRGAKARLQHQVDALSGIRAEIHDWAAARQDEAMTQSAAMVHTVAGLTLSLAETTMAAARALTADMSELLRRWAGEPDRIRDIAGRADWLLDGWDRVCAIWCSAQDTQSQELALTEIAGLIPVMPKEVTQWVSMEGGGSQIIDREVTRHRRVVRFKEDWLTGQSVFDEIARNERLRAAC